MQMITKYLAITSQETVTGLTRSLQNPEFWESSISGDPARESSAGLSYFKIQAETVPSSKSCCAWKPSVQTSGFIPALISTYVVVSSGTLPTEFSQQPRKSPNTA